MNCNIDSISWLWIPLRYTRGCWLGLLSMIFLKTGLQALRKILWALNWVWSSETSTWDGLRRCASWECISLPLFLSECKLIRRRSYRDNLWDNLSEVFLIYYYFHYFHLIKRIDWNPLISNSREWYVNKLLDNKIISRAPQHLLQTLQTSIIASHPDGNFVSKLS